ncbi:MAG: potassium transporter Kup [Bdellovibrio sp.]|nr:MAG: potassium transporter Kup [Bdellovibrio sp.]
MNRKSQTLSALGVVFGDIGTSPLYAVSVAISSLGAGDLQPEAVMGCISLILWALIIVVTLKYVIFVMRADNDGQGGVFALYGLLHLKSGRQSRDQDSRRGLALQLWILILAAGLLFGDGVITPAISVLSAMEGLSVIAPASGSLVVPLTVLMLAALFAVQFMGTSRIGGLFGPITLLWFVTITYFGLRQILVHPEILWALNPMFALQFFAQHTLRAALVVLGGVMLVVTGGEALYADMGHFGKSPIRRAWFAVVFPALIVSYLGQGAFLLSGAHVGNVFFSSLPSSSVLPVVILATAATVIASQALISGAFSLTAQASALGLFPRLKLVHTHHQHEGQVYSPLVNSLLFIGSVWLVIRFGSSLALGSAYGLAVSGNMFATSIAMITVAQSYWRWTSWQAFGLFGAFAAVDLVFLISNCTKFEDGGYIPVTIAAVLFMVMVSWRWGRKATFNAYMNVNTMTMAELIALRSRQRHFLDKNVILMVPNPLLQMEDRAPALLQLFWERYGVFPRHLIFLQVMHRKSPFIHDERYRVTTFVNKSDHGSVSSMTVYFGFMEDPNVEAILETTARNHLVDLSPIPGDWMIHTSIENILAPGNMSVLRRWRLKVFLLLRQISTPGYYYYGLGNRVQLSIEVLPVRLGDAFLRT